MPAEAPSETSRQRQQLTEVVAKLHPDARLRSFAHGAATFLNRQYLIVAFYADITLEDGVAADAGAADTEQRPLFA